MWVTELLFLNWAFMFLIIWCFRYWSILCIYGKMHLTVHFPKWHWHSHPLAAGNCRKHSCPLILPQPRPARTSGQAFQRQDFTIQQPNLQRKCFTPADVGGCSGWRQIQMLYQHHHRKQGIVYKPWSKWYGVKYEYNSTWNKNTEEYKTKSWAFRLYFFNLWVSLHI